MDVVLDKAIPIRIRSAGTLTVDGTAFSFSDGSFSNQNKVVRWAVGSLSWTDNQQVSLALTVPATTVSLSASPNPVAEGAKTDVTMTLSKAPGTQLTIPFTVTEDTAESGDYRVQGTFGFNATDTTSTVEIFTNVDADADHETLAMALGALPSGYVAGSQSSVTIQILDTSDQLTKATLSVSPNPVTEGSAATVTVTLSKALRFNWYFPLTVTNGTAEPRDYRPSWPYGRPGILVPAGSRTATVTIAAALDADTDDETFTLALGALPKGVTRGNTTSADVTITDSNARTVSLEVIHHPTEGSPARVTARLSGAVSTDRVIPVTLARGTAEDGDYGALASITIPAYPRYGGTGSIATHQDADTDDETFTVALGSPLPAGITAGSPERVTVTIMDDDGGGGPRPEVRLSASPNPVAEGSPVTVTATLSSARGGDVTIPLTLTDGTAEDGDHGALPSITISGGSRTGTGSIATNQDADTDDETFTVALGSLPSSVRAGSPSSVQVTISEGGGGGDPRPEVRLSASPNPVAEGSPVTVTATLSSALGGGVTIPLTLTPGTADDGDYGTLESITISGGSRTGAGSIATSQDADTDDETFTVALGSLPSSVRAGSPSSVQVTISEGGGGGGQEPTTTSSDASLSGLTISAGGLAFDPATTSYAADVPHGVSSVTLTPTTSHAGATVAVNGAAVASGEASAAIALAVGENVILVVVTAEDGTTTRTYTVTVTRAALPAALTLSADPEPAEGGAAVTVTATLDQPAPEDGTTVALTTGGTATPGTDYTLSSTTIAIAEGGTAGTATITVVDDAEDDDGETIVLDAAAVNPTLTAATLTLTIEDNDVTWTLSGPADPNLVEGRSYMLTARASSAVESDTTVEIGRDPAASEAGDDDFSVEPIVIEAGGTTGTTTLTVTADDLPDGGTGTSRGETLVLVGSVDGVAVGALTFTLWDAAVPALPTGGALMLGALLLRRGAVRFRRRASVGRPLTAWDGHGLTRAY